MKVRLLFFKGKNNMNKDFSCNVDACLYCIELLDNAYVLLEFFSMVR